MQKVDVPTINYKFSQLGGLDRYQDIFARSLMQQFTALGDATNAIINLPNFINSNTNYVYFTILPMNALVRSIGFDYIDNIVSFHLINSSGESLCGRSPVLSNVGLFILDRGNTRGSYCTETNASTFSWIQTTDGFRTLASGAPLGSSLYDGSEN